MNKNYILKNVTFDEKGLVSVITQDATTSTVLMQAYMNEEALNITLDTKEVTYFSRSRNQLWKKGETSGNLQYLEEIFVDCDGDAILIKVKQLGPACHKGNYSCFTKGEDDINNELFNTLYTLIKERKEVPLEGSYTNYLFEKGIDKILKKVGEENAEIIIAAKNEGNEELIYEISDYIYHLFVLMVEKEVSLYDIIKELKRREK